MCMCGGCIHSVWKCIQHRQLLISDYKNKNNFPYKCIALWLNAYVGDKNATKPRKNHFYEQIV